MEKYGVINSVPSALALEPMEIVSKKYKFLPTTQAIDIFMESGWEPVQASQVYIRSKVSLRNGFQKHLIKFRNPKLGMMKVGGKDTVIELLLKNSHDTTACFHIMAGLFVILCTNGLVVTDSLMGNYKIPHLGFAVEKVKNAIDDIVERVPAVAKKVRNFSGIKLTEDEREQYALNALMLKYDIEDINSGAYDLKCLIEPRRKQDEAPTLWNTYNIVQENLLNGGNFTYNKFGTLIQSRPIKAIDANIRINKSLWDLTEEYARRKN